MGLSDLKVQVGNEEVENVVGKYGVPGRNLSGRSFLEMCMKYVGWGNVFSKSRRKMLSHGGG